MTFDWLTKNTFTQLHQSGIEREKEREREKAKAKARERKEAKKWC